MNLAPDVPAKPTTEWGIPHPDEDLRQGDILVARSEDDTRLSRVLYVMTADCDLANKKHYGRLACVPVIPLDRYISDFRLVRDIDRHRERLGDAIVGEVNRARVERAQKQFTAERILTWIGEVDPTHVLSTLCLAADAAPGTALQLLIEAYNVSAEPSGGLSTQIERLQRCMNALDPNALPDRAAKCAIERTRELISDPPRDIHLLAEISPRHRDGYVVALRFVEQVFDYQIDLGDRPERPYQRVARVWSPYVYSISQRFGQLFTAVGLPDNHHASVRLSAEVLIESFAATKGKL